MKKIIANMNWIIGCRLARAVLQLLVGMLTARYLGPSNYGLISYAASLAAFALPVMQLGLRNTLVQEYLSNREEEGQILGTALGMNLLSATACILGIVGFSAVANPGSQETVIVCSLYSLSLLFQAFELVQYWFQSRLESKYPSVVMLVGYILVSGYKLYLLASGRSVYWFALAYSLEAAVIALGLLLCYWKCGGRRISFSRESARLLFFKSKYYLLSGILVAAFQYTDRVMLKWMTGNAQTGFYSTAATIAGMTGFVFAAVIDSARPGILEKKQVDPKGYANAISGLYAVVIWASLAQSVALTLLAKPAVYILYGAQYAPAVPVLRLVCWYTVFSYMGTVRNIWILAEGQQKWLLMLNIGGVLINIGLNAVLIPRWNACGAAAASVLTQLTINGIVSLCLPAMAAHRGLLLRGIHPKTLLQILKQKGE